MTLHSLTLKEEFQDDFTRKYQQTPSGEIIWIDEPPLCVNVELPLSTEYEMFNCSLNGIILMVSMKYCTLLQSI